MGYIDVSDIEQDVICVHLSGRQHSLILVKDHLQYKGQNHIFRCFISKENSIATKQKATKDKIQKPASLVYISLS